MRLAIAAVFAALLAGCSQQATADLAVCKSELARAQSDIATAKSAQTAAETKAGALEQQVATLNAQLTKTQGQAAAAQSKAAHAKGAVKKAVAEKEEKPVAAPAADPNRPPPAPMTREQRRRVGF